MPGLTLRVLEETAALKTVDTGAATGSFQPPKWAA